MTTWLDSQIPPAKQVALDGELHKAEVPPVAAGMRPDLGHC